jgi:hypothetical protein
MNTANDRSTLQCSPARPLRPGMPSADDVWVDLEHLRSLASKISDDKPDDAPKGLPTRSTRLTSRCPPGGGQLGLA